MSRIGAEYTLASAMAALLVLGAGVALAGPEGSSGVIAGTVSALLVQVAVFWALFVVLLPRQRGLAHGLGAMIRFAAVAVMAFWGLAGWGLAPVPTLFSMVACLFVTTLLEPLFLRRQDAVVMSHGAPAMRAQS